MKVFLFIFIFCFSTIAIAQDLPVEISAAGSLEWNRTAKTYTATKDVVARRGDAIVKSDTLTAYYTATDNAGDISEIVATGAVTISSPPYTAYGDKGVYDVRTGNVILTGKKLRMESGAEYLTARDKIVFQARENTLDAIGAATAHKEGRTLNAERLTAWFEESPSGKMVTKKITATGGVVIKTENETVTGSSGTYNIASQIATLTGKVRILQGDNRLEGTKATVNMKTGVSQLFAAENTATDGRVKGVFYPKKKAE